MPVIDGKQFPSRTPQCDLWRSWAHDPEDTKSNPLVRPRKCQANSEPSLIAGEGHVSWLIVSLLALTRQKQLVKSRPQMQGLSLSRLPFLKEQPFRQDALRIFVTIEKWDRKAQLTKIKFCCTGIYVHRRKHVLNRHFWETSPKIWFCELPEM